MNIIHAIAHTIIFFIVLTCYCTVFKDGGKEVKKKDISTKGLKCYFIRTDPTSANDTETPYIFSGKSINEARMHFMHVHTLPSLPDYMICTSVSLKFLLFFIFELL